MTIGIIGGGYAGLATAIELKRLGFDGAVTLYDARTHHQKITQWHKLARGKMPDRYEESFENLAKRFHFNFEKKHIDVSTILKEPEKTLGQSFDAIVIAQGAQAPAKPAGVITLDALRDDTAAQVQVQSVTGKKISVIGGGPTGVQFAFEFAARGNQVEIFEMRDRLLPTFDNALGQTAVKASEAAGIKIHFSTEFLHFENGMISGRSGAVDSAHRADMVLFVPGVRSTPSFTCDVFGRVENFPRHKFYAAGDNSFFSGRGLNTKSAQAAVRKGQNVARTLVADFAGSPGCEYTYAELGYFVSLGPHNAVGYMLSQKTAFRGRAALFMKEVIEKQYDLYLAGLPVY